MSQQNNQFSSSQWGATFGSHYSGYQQSIKKEASSTAAPLRFDGSSSNGDAMNALIGIIGGGLTSTLSELQVSIGEIKTQNNTNSTEIKEKIGELNKSSWHESLFNPATLAVLGIVTLLILCIIAGILKKYTNVGLADLKDYILLFGGGLVGLLGGDKIKNNTK
uniref:hypothetical protein n=1 Tax=Rahnella sp. WMR42 TaxID=657334 RepID=UPI0001C4B2C8|nr:hypothetical protein [Rahnella sp. WMR42]CAZ68141.1 hypothetical protein [Rahnella sp. WMR42]